MSQRNRLLTTKELPTVTGLSSSFFEKGRVYGYGPKYIQITSNGRAGKVLYRPEDVENWLAQQERNPEAGQ